MKSVEKVKDLEKNAVPVVHRTMNGIQPIVNHPNDVLQHLQAYTKDLFYTNGAKPLEVSEAGKIVSEEIYMAEYLEHGDFHYEWKNGVLEEKPMASIPQSKMYQWFHLLIFHFLETFPIAQLITHEVGNRFPIPGGTVIRKPDIGIVLNTNPDPIVNEDDIRTYEGICDICIEVLSDSSLGEIERDIDDKFGEYEYAGVREYYILDNRRGRHMSFYELDPATGRYVPMDVGPDGIVRSTVLTGFQFRIEDLYRQPSLLQMVNDPVYQHFVMTEYQRERRRAQQEAQRAEAERRAREAADRRAAQEAQRAQQEAQRAEQEAQRAEQEAHKSMKYAELLRSMGIDPDAIE